MRNTFEFIQRTTWRPAMRSTVKLIIGTTLTLGALWQIFEAHLYFAGAVTGLLGYFAVGRWWAVRIELPNFLAQAVALAAFAEGMLECEEPHLNRYGSPQCGSDERRGVEPGDPRPLPDNFYSPEEWALAMVDWAPRERMRLRQRLHDDMSQREAFLWDEKLKMQLRERLFQLMPGYTGRNYPTDAETAADIEAKRAAQQSRAARRAAAWEAYSGGLGQLESERHRFTSREPGPHGAGGDWDFKAHEPGGISAIDLKPVPADFPSLQDWHAAKIAWDKRERRRLVERLDLSLTALGLRGAAARGICASDAEDENSTSSP